MSGPEHALPQTETPIWHLFDAVCRQLPSKLAVDDGVTALSYAALRDAALAVAEQVSRHVPPGGLVSVVLRHSACHPIGVLACLASGHPCLVLDAFHPASRNAQAIADAHAGVVLLDRLAPAQVPALPASCARIGLAEHHAGASSFVATPADLDAPAFVISTSGSTGAPKGIVLSQSNMLHQFTQDVQCCRLTPTDRFLPLGSPAAISPLRGLLSALLSGGSLYLRDLHDGFARLLATMRTRRITVSRIGPSLLRAMVALPRASEAFRSMRIIRVGGEILSGADVMRMRNVLPAGCTLVFAYGSTELPPLIQRLIGMREPVEEGPLRIGTPLPGSRLTLIDDDGAEVRPGEPGELLVCGPNLALGYWSGGTCVAGDILTDPDITGQRCFRSGDMLRCLPDGQWEFLGRADRQVKIRGNRVEPGEAEAVLRALPGVADAVVLVYSESDAVTLRAFVVPSGRAAATFAAELRAALAQRLPDHLRPSRIQLVEAIPRLNTFKPDLAALRAMER